MRALIRMRTLAAVCALLLMFAGMAAAGPRVRFDRPGQPDVPDPPMVGDPDDPQGLLLGFQMPWGYMQIRIRGAALNIFGLNQPARRAAMHAASIRRGTRAR